MQEVNEVNVAEFVSDCDNQSGWNFISHVFLENLVNK